MKSMNEDTKHPNKKKYKTFWGMINTLSYVNMHSIGGKWHSI